MGTSNYLVDTNILIEYLGNTLSENATRFTEQIFEESFTISIINKIELLGFSKLTVEDEHQIKSLLSFATILPLTESIAETTIDLRKKYKIKLPDALIASTAIVHNLTLLTRNSKDFNLIKELSINNPQEV